MAEQEINLYPEASEDRPKVVSIPQGDGGFVRFRFEPPSPKTNESGGTEDTALQEGTIHRDSR